MALLTSPFFTTFTLSIEGEWSGNTISTPSPYETLRTVNVSVRPEPARAMTVPSNVWMRDLPSSTIFNWTSTVSPTLNCGISFFKNFASTNLTILLSISYPFPFDDVRPALSSPLQCFRRAPGFNLPMVSAQQNLRHLFPYEFCRPCILRILEHSAFK